MFNIPGKDRRSSRRVASRKISFETLETRRMLTADPLNRTFAPGVYVPSTTQEHTIANKAGYDLAHLWSDWSAYESGGGEVRRLARYVDRLNTGLQV